MHGRHGVRKETRSGRRPLEMAGQRVHARLESRQQPALLYAAQQRLEGQGHEDHSATQTGAKCGHDGARGIP